MPDLNELRAFFVGRDEAGFKRTMYGYAEKWAEREGYPDTVLIAMKKVIDANWASMLAEVINEI